MDTDELISLHREFLKDSVRLRFDFSATAQSRGIPPPALQKPYPADARTVALPGPERFGELGAASLLSLLRSRRSVRRYSNEPFSLPELAFLLWATQGVIAHPGPAVTLRTVPSAGARHAFETYLYCRRVEGLEEGIWRYGPAAHRVLPLDAGPVCQNLDLAAEAIGAGVCAVGAYDQQALDALLRLDGEEEFVLYLAPAGKKAE